MTETKKPTDDKAKTTTNEEELSEDQLEQVAGGAVLPQEGPQVKGESIKFVLP